MAKIKLDSKGTAEIYDVKRLIGRTVKKVIDLNTESFIFSKLFLVNFDILEFI